MATTILDRPNIVPLIQIASFTVFGDALLKAVQAAFTDYEKMEFHSITSIIFSTFKTGLVILLVVLGFRTPGATIGATTAFIISGIIAVIILYMTLTTG